MTLHEPLISDTEENTKRHDLVPQSGHFQTNVTNADFILSE